MNLILLLIAIQKSKRNGLCDFNIVTNYMTIVSACFLGCFILKPVFLSKFFCCLPELK